MINSLKNACFSLPQYLLPQHALSSLMHRITRCEIRWWKNFAIRSVVSVYGVNLREAMEEDYSVYPSFNHFFTRALKSSARPIVPNDAAVLSPADGAVSQIGRIDGDRIIQAKGHTFSLIELLGGDPDLASPFRNGHFTTIYLSPRDYHRLHMPSAGTLIEMRHIPGRLFSVNNATTEFVPGLFARNERVVATFHTPLGNMALVLVGAIFVSSIETVWHGEVTPPTSPTIRTWNYEDRSLELAQGEEMGRFNMGSTIIVLLEPGTIAWSEDLEAGSTVRMGQPIGAAQAR